MINIRKRVVSTIQMKMVCFVVVFLSMSMSVSSYAATNHQVKAALVYQFIKYTKWSQSDQDIIILGVVGNEKEFSNFSIYQGKRIQNKKLVIKKVSSRNDMKNCSALYISRTSKLSTASVLNTVGHKPMLTIGESRNFIAQGGTINFVRKGKKQKFVINRAKARTASFKLDHKLLRLSVNP